MTERIRNYQAKKEAPPGYHNLVESIPGGFVITKRVEKPEVAEKAKA
jgi:hypothetical protein